MSAPEKAAFAAGCFWGVEEAFAELPGVVSTAVGYTGGSTANPSYEEVCSGTTGHAEAVEVEFDPVQISYEGLLAVFWGIHDPTTANRQGPDVGTQYRSAIFYHSREQKEAIETSVSALKATGKFKGEIVTEVAPAGPFYPAEDYHQKYFAKCRLR